MIGKTLGHYQITEKLGEGGMGVVYKARDTHLDRFVAIKVLPPERVADPERKRRFIQEAKAASALNHPSIITIHDIDQADGIDFIAMEYVAGKTLDDLIPRKGMRLSLALKYAVQIADALARAHGAGIIHRDLKPSNLMVDEHGLVKVLDFGLAKLTEVGGPEAATVSTQTAGGVIVGTAAYMSPEQAEGKLVDTRSDIFSFGSVLYEMLTGQRAFRGDTRVSTIASILREEPQPVRQIAEGIPREVERIIKLCLRKDPAQRYRHIDDIKVELEELKRESDSQPAAHDARGKAKGRLRWISAGLIVVSALAATVWFLRLRGEPELPPPRVVSLTSYRGVETTPSFSPDGNQVAFAWDGEKRDNVDIYVKAVGELHALQLTKDIAPDRYPAWSPDGKHIAFCRFGAAEKRGIYLISPLGGPERKVSDLTFNWASWTPDGKQLVAARPRPVDTTVEDLSGIYQIPVDGGPARRITAPNRPIVDKCPAVSPGGKILAFARCTDPYSCDIYCQQFGPEGSLLGEARRLTRQNSGIAGIAWGRDGKSIIYSASRFWGMKYYLWHVGAISGDPVRLEYVGPYAVAPAVAIVKNRLAFAYNRGVQDIDIWRFREGAAPEPLITSSLVDTSPDVSPDGKKIVFSSDRAGEAYDIWVANVDGSNPVQLTHENGAAGTPRWSPDGQTILFDLYTPAGEIDLYSVKASGGSSHRLTPEGTSEVLPSFSPDGKWIYFRSNRSGSEQIWKMPSEGGAAQQITQNGADTAKPSVDGKTLYYTKPTSPELFAISSDGGVERIVIDSVLTRCSAVTSAGIYYISRQRSDGKYALCIFDPLTSKNRLLTLLDGPINQGLTITPDGKTVIYTRNKESNSDLMLVENFR